MQTDMATVLMNLLEKLDTVAWRSFYFIIEEERSRGQG